MDLNQIAAPYLVIRGHKRFDTTESESWLMLQIVQVQPRQQLVPHVFTDK